MKDSAWKPVNWIFFDLDDTLWNFRDNSEKSLIKLYQISPILRKLFKDSETFIEIYHQNNFLMWELYSQGKISTKELKVERWRRTLATRQFEVLTAVCEELDRNYLDILALGKEMIPGVSNMLERLSEKFMIGILSNGFSDTQYKKLYHSGLEKFITRTIVSEELGVNKPDKRIFEYAVAETGATEPLLMVGDHPITDVLGAMQAGWNAIWYNPKGLPFPLSQEEMKNQGINPSLLIGIVNDISSLEKTINQFFS